MLAVAISDFGSAFLAGVALLSVLAAIGAFARSVRAVKLGPISLDFIPELDRETEQVREALSALEPDARQQDVTAHKRPRISESDSRTVALLREYHAHSLGQSRTSFRFSLIFASLGFLIIAGTVVNAVALQNYGYVEAGTVGGANIVALVAGTLIEAVSALFFVNSNRARTVMTTFFDKLRSDRALDEAIELSDQVPDPLIRSRLKTVLALSLAESGVSDDVARAVMATPPAPHERPTSDGQASDSAEDQAAEG